MKVRSDRESESDLPLIRKSSDREAGATIASSLGRKHRCLTVTRSSVLIGSTVEAI
jgi:hypothetical protein